MPLIDIRSQLRDLADKGYKETRSEFQFRNEDANRMLKFFASSQGGIFAAKQALLNPEDAVARVARALAATQLSRVPFGLVSPEVIPGVQGSAEEKSTIKVRYENGPVYPEKGHTSQYKAIIDSTIKQKSAEEKKVKTYRDVIDVRGAYAKNDSNLLYGPEADLNQIDSVPFYFTTYQVNDGVLSNNFTLAFPAFFQSISDNVTGNWNSFKYTGRGEQFYVYQMYGRTISMTFKVAAFSEAELGIIHNKLGSLRSFAAPTYNGNGYMKGNFLKLTIGNYAKNLPGFVSNVGFSVDTNVPWEIIDREQILPHVVNVTVAYTVIEQATPTAQRPNIPLINL